jgi:hypothetical protein
MDYSASIRCRIKVFTEPLPSSYHIRDNDTLHLFQFLYPRKWGVSILIHKQQLLHLPSTRNRPIARPLHIYDTKTNINANYSRTSMSQHASEYADIVISSLLVLKQLTVLRCQC